MKKGALFAFFIGVFLLFQGWRSHDYFPDGKDKKDAKKGCDTAKLVRTSSDSMILKKYQKVYSRMGGVCYIIHLQELAKVKKVSDSTYNVKVKESNTAEARADWSTYLFCPIGKPNGTVTLLAANGDTVQQCTYKDERKNGWMIWWKAKNEIMTAVKFTNDEQKVRKVDTLVFPGG
jgi:hypothetical protein